MAERYRDKIVSLPPPDVRLYDPLNNPTHEKLPTPVDDRGLVHIPQLISDVKATISPEYEWPHALSRHHFYWPAAGYPYENGVEGNFRNLTINKGLVLREFENWLHEVTEPPPKPDLEVMSCQIEAWTVAKDLFKMARRTVQYEKLARRRQELILENPNIVGEGFDGKDPVGEAYMAEQFDRNFFGLDFHLLRNEELPAEHRLAEISGPPEEIARRLGKLVAPNSSHLVRAIRAAA